MAEAVGFELTVPVKGQRFSRPPQSTTLPRLRDDGMRTAVYTVGPLCATPLHPKFVLSVFQHCSRNNLGISKLCRVERKPFSRSLHSDHEQKDFGLLQATGGGQFAAAFAGMTFF